MNKIDDKDITEVCKLGQGEECCAYLILGSSGAKCAKGTMLAYNIELRLANGTMNAKGDNCEGMIEKIMLA